MNQALSGTLARWLTGPRIAGLPAPAAMPAPRLSFEFFPPKTDKLEEQLWACIRVWRVCSWRCWWAAR